MALYCFRRRSSISAEVMVQLPFAEYSLHCTPPTLPPATNSFALIPSCRVGLVNTLDPPYEELHLRTCLAPAGRIVPVSA